MPAKIILLIFLLRVCAFHAQNNLDIKLLGARFLDTTKNKEVVVVFQVTARDTAEFPPTVNLPPKCTVFENGFEKVVLIGPQNLIATFDDLEVPEDPPATYSFIKDSIDHTNPKTSLLVVYEVKDIPFTFSRMSFTPSFSGKRNKDARTTKRVEFTVSRNGNAYYNRR